MQRLAGGRLPGPAAVMLSRGELERRARLRAKLAAEKIAKQQQDVSVTI